jgi:hypothetical protein
LLSLQPDILDLNLFDDFFNLLLFFFLIDSSHLYRLLIVNLCVFAETLGLSGRVFLICLLHLLLFLYLLLPLIGEGEIEVGLFLLLRERLRENLGEIKGVSRRVLLPSRLWGIGLVLLESRSVED